MAYDSKFMIRALELAQKAGLQGEVPVGAVIVQNGRIVGEGFNFREQGKNPLAHAEIIAIENAAACLGGWRLVDCEMYVTLEPCMMCAGALVQCRMVNLYIGALDLKAGAVVSKVNLLDEPWLNHQVIYEYGHMADESSEMLKAFFKRLRGKSK